MDSKLVSFISVLRGHQVRVSPAETLDAVGVVSLLGYGDRGALRTGLSQALAKTPEDKATFLRCFDRFFTHTLPGNLAEQPADDTLTENQPGNPPAANAPDIEPGQAAADTDIDPGTLDNPAPGTLDNPAPGTLDNNQSGDSQARALQEAMDADPALAAQLDVPLLNMLRGGDRNGLALGIARAGEQVGLAKIHTFTQKGQYTRKILDALGEEHIRGAIIGLENSNNPALGVLQNYRDRLRELVRDHVEREYLLHAQGRNSALMDEVLSTARLSNIEHHYLHRVHELVRKMAKRLAARHSRRRRQTKRGQLDMARTLRRGVAHDGVMFNVYWKSVKKERPQILAVCDVSGSVSAYAKFLLMFLYSLYDVLPQVRSFAFSSHLGEVSDLFGRHPIEKAIEMVNLKYGGATDYGRSLLDFARLALDDIDSNTTVIILGDARNNHGDPRLDLLQSIYARARQVLWLNPESRALWGSGDSEMPRYRSACHFTAECGNLRQLERVIDQLLRWN